METLRIEGIAEISEKGFRFDSGMPSNEPVLNAPLKMHGTLKVGTNACVDFTDSCSRVYLPPEVHKISEGNGYKVKRTSRNYIIHVKVPVVESRKASEERINAVISKVLGDIVLDRREVLGAAMD